MNLQCLRSRQPGFEEDASRCAHLLREIVRGAVGADEPLELLEEPLADAAAPALWAGGGAEAFFMPLNNVNLKV